MRAIVRKSREIFGLLDKRADRVRADLLRRGGGRADDVGYALLYGEGHTGVAVAAAADCGIDFIVGGKIRVYGLRAAFASSVSMSFLPSLKKCWGFTR